MKRKKLLYKSGSKVEFMLSDAETPDRDRSFLMGFSINGDDIAKGKFIFNVTPVSIKMNKEQRLYTVWTDNPFTDIKGDPWYKRYIGFVYGLRAMTGYDSTTFSWNDKLTRGEAITVLHKIEDQPKPDAAAGHDLRCFFLTVGI